MFSLFVHLSITSRLITFLGYCEGSYDKQGYTSIFKPFRCIPRTGQPESHGNSNFSFLWHHHIDFHGDCTSLHSYQQWIRAPFSLHPCQHVLPYIYIYNKIYIYHSSWHEIEPQGVLICISQTSKDIECVLQKLLAICFLFWKVPI